MNTGTRKREANNAPLYFTIDSYGRRRAHLFGGDTDGEETQQINTADSLAEDPGLAGMDMSGLTQLPVDATTPLSGWGKFKAGLKDSGEDIIGGVSSLGDAIGDIAKIRNRKGPSLLQKVGVKNYRNKYTFDMGGAIGAAGGALGAAGDIAKATAENASTVDTTELEESIHDKANVQVKATSNDELMGEWSARGPQLNHVSFKDMRGASPGQKVGNVLKAGVSGASSGAKGGPIGAAVGAVGGMLASGIGAIFGRRKAKKKAKKINKMIDAAEERNLTSFEQRAQNIEARSDLNTMANFSALGGPLGIYNPYNINGPIEFDLAQQYLDNQRLRAEGDSAVSDVSVFANGGGIHINPANRGKLTATAKRTGKSFSELAHSSNPLTRKRAQFALNARKWNHKRAYGGDYDTNGGTWDLGYTTIGNGGTHEYNPYDGVQIGVASDGKPNLVEQNEILYNNYVFSNRLNAPRDLLEAYNLPSRYTGKTFSDIAADIAGVKKERPNDPISQKAFESQMERLVQAQEYLREVQRRQQQAIEQASLMRQAQEQAYRQALVQQQYRGWNDAALARQYARQEETEPQAEYGDRGEYAEQPEGQLFAAGGPFKNYMRNLFGKDPKESVYILPEDVFDQYLGNTVMDAEGNVYDIGEDGITIDGKTYTKDENGDWVYADGDNKETLALRDWSKADAYGDLDFNTAKMYLDQARKGNTQAQDWLRENLGGMTLRQFNDWAALHPDTGAFPTAGRNAPIYGDVAGLLMNGFMGNYKAPANAIQEAANAAGMYDKVAYNPIGNYLSYNPLDTQYALNQLNAQFGATNSAIRNNANGNRAAANAALLAAQYNYGNQVGSLYRQAQEYNDQLRQKVEEFNRGTNMANSEGFLKADMANQTARQNAMNSRLQGTVYAQNMKNSNYYDWLQGLVKGVGNTMGDISAKAKENVAFNMARSNPNFYYTLNGDGTVRHAGGRARGGYLTIPGKRRKRRR